MLRLKTENVHADYLSAGLNGVVASNYAVKSILKLIHLYSDINDCYTQRTILKAIKHLINKDKFDISLIDILEANKDIKYEGIIKDKDKFQTIHDHMSSSINSFEGDFAELLPQIYKHIFNDESSKNRVLSLINEVIAKNVDFVVFGLLRTIGMLESVDKKLFAKLIKNLLENDKVGQVTIYCLQNIHYLYLNNYVSKKELVEYLKKCISFINYVQDGEDTHYIQDFGMFLFYYYLNEKDEIFDKILNEAVSSNNKVIYGIYHQIFERELNSKDNEKVKKSKKFILKHKSDETNEDIHSLRLEKMNGLNFIQNDFEFVTGLISSLNIRREVNDFIKYLQNEYHLDTSISGKIFKLLAELIKILDSGESDYYDSRLLIEFILELNTRAKSDENKKEILNLIDKFLESDTLRFNTKSAIE